MIEYNRFDRALDIIYHSSDKNNHFNTNIIEETIIGIIKATVAITFFILLLL